MFRSLLPYLRERPQHPSPGSQGCPGSPSTTSRRIWTRGREAVWKRPAPTLAGYIEWKHCSSAPSVSRKQGCECHRCCCRKRSWEQWKIRNVYVFYKPSSSSGKYGHSENAYRRPGLQAGRSLGPALWTAKSHWALVCYFVNNHSTLIEYGWAPRIPLYSVITESLYDSTKKS